MQEIRTAAVIAVFCASGGLARYYLSGWVCSLAGRSFPCGTLLVNIIGAYLIGLLMAFTDRSDVIPDTLRIGLSIGFLGGLTTFSSFSYETLQLVENGRFLLASLNIIASVALCLLFTWLGIITVRTLV